MIENSLNVVSVRLVRDTPILSNQKISTPEDALDIVGDYLCDMDREIVAVINLKADSTPINVNFASMGTINSSLLNPSEIFKTAILSNASQIIIVHNHPSGNLTPSDVDIMMTDRMIQCCELMNIPLLDHVIVGGDNKTYFSLRNKGLMENSKIKMKDDIDELEFNQILKRKIR